MTPEQLKQICPTVKNPDTWAPLLTFILPDYHIDTTNRQAMFLAQCLHESGGFKFLRELWGPSKWQEKYEGHVGLGNTQPGDGKRFLGRGLIQLTGRANYQNFANWMKKPEIMNSPELVEQPDLAIMSAVWFWDKNYLNRMADSDNIEQCTRIVNGPKMLGLEERKKYYERGKQVLQS